MMTLFTVEYKETLPVKRLFIFLTRMIRSISIVRHDKKMRLPNLYIYDNSTYMNLQKVAQLDGSNIIILNYDCNWIKNIIADTIIPLD